jgi:hypothetical protein
MTYSVIRNTSDRASGFQSLCRFAQSPISAQNCRVDAVGSPVDGPPGRALPLPPPRVRGYDIDAVAQIDSLELTYEWFDYVMRDRPRPELLEDRINFEVMGAGLWRHTPSIDAMSNEKLVLYLTNEKVGEQYRLSALKPDRLAYLKQTVDFADRASQNRIWARASS